MKFIPAFLLAALVARAVVMGADADHKSPPNIRIEVQVIAIPEPLALPLVADLMKKDKIEAANAKIQELLHKGTAKLIGWPMVTTHSGMRATVDAIREERYATEYTAPAVKVTPNVNGTETFTVEPKLDLTQLEGIPTAFETRNTGVTLEVEAKVSADGKRIDLNVEPQHVRLKGFNKVTIDKPSTGGKVVLEQPGFDVMKVTTSLTLRNGERVLMGVYRTDDPPKHLEIFLLKAQVIPLE